MTNEEIAGRIQRGETDLLPQLWEQVHPLICWHANRFYIQHQERCIASGVTADDIIQTGYFAVLDAVQAYDPAPGYKFNTYLRYPLKNRFKAATGGRENNKIDSLNRCTSLDSTIAGDSDITGADILTDPSAERDFEDIIECIHADQMHTALEECMQRIPAEQAKTLRARYYENQTLTELAAAKSASHQAIRQQEVNGLRNMRRGVNYTRLKEYREHILSSTHRYTGYKSFRSLGHSSVEWTVEKLSKFDDPPTCVNSPTVK